LILQTVSYLLARLIKCSVEESVHFLFVLRLTRKQNGGFNAVTQLLLATEGCLLKPSVKPFCYGHSLYCGTRISFSAQRLPILTFLAVLYSSFILRVAVINTELMLCICSGCVCVRGMRVLRKCKVPLAEILFVTIQCENVRPSTKEMNRAVTMIPDCPMFATRL
jgi:hypothetical protein